MQKERGAGRFFMVLVAGVLMVLGVMLLSQTGSAKEDPIPYVSIIETEEPEDGLR